MLTVLRLGFRYYLKTNSVKASADSFRNAPSSLVMTAVSYSTLENIVKWGFAGQYRFKRVNPSLFQA